MRRSHATVHAAYVALLALPDEPCLPRRGRRYVQAGKRHLREGIKRDLERAWISWRMFEAGKAPSSAVCRLSVVRRRA